MNYTIKNIIRVIMNIDNEYIHNILLQKADLCNKSSKYFMNNWENIYSINHITFDEYINLYYYLKYKLSNNRNFVFRMRSILENKKLKIYFYFKPVDFMKYSRTELSILNTNIIKRKHSNENIIQIKVTKYNIIKYNKLKKIIRKLNEYLYYKDIFEIKKNNNNIFIYSKKIPYHSS